MYTTSVTGFWFDAATSIPFSWTDWSVLQVRGLSGSLSGAGPAG
jgi:hypothetical protein